MFRRNVPYEEWHANKQKQIKEKQRRAAEKEHQEQVLYEEGTKQRRELILQRQLETLVRLRSRQVQQHGKQNSNDSSMYVHTEERVVSPVRAAVQKRLHESHNPSTSALSSLFQSERLKFGYSDEELRRITDGTPGLQFL
eukprot:PhF_6_TR34642/c0_g1_i1/m.50417